MASSEKQKPSQLEGVKELILLVLEGHALPTAVEKLRQYAINHASDCALGCTPACTCGHGAARNFMRVFRNEVQLQDLILKESQPAEGLTLFSNFD